MVDLKLLLNHSSLLEAIRNLGGPKLTRRIDLLIKAFPLLPIGLFPKVGTTLRRLSYFGDKEMKVRVVAILDYWSQTALRSLHLYIFKVLKKIPQDCTFNQGSFTDKVKD